MSLSDKTTKEIKAIIQKFITENGFVKSEENVQTSYTIKILELLGWDSSMYKINTSQEVKTGNKPDILLKGSGGGTIFIIESKAPKPSLDGKYVNKSFAEQTFEYCNSEGIYWGVLTNFIEWRIYNIFPLDNFFIEKCNSFGSDVGIHIPRDCEKTDGVRPSWPPRSGRDARAPGLFHNL